MTEIKVQELPKIDVTEQLTTSLKILGAALKSWDGKDLEIIGNSSKDVLKNSNQIFKENNNRDYLLCHFLVQYIISMLLSRTLFAGALNLKSNISPDTFVELGDKFIKVGENVGKTQFQSTLLDVLAFVYDKQLVPVI